MPTNYYRRTSGLGSATAYQIASIPYLSASLAVEAVSGTPLEICFPYVSKWVTIKNAAHVTASARPLRFGISSVGVKGDVQNNYGVLCNGEAYTGEWRITRLYLLGDSSVATTASVLAGLTGIDSGELATNWTGSAGVG